jgi:hypothetical protein
MTGKTTISTIAFPAGFIRFPLLWNSQQYVFYTAKSTALLLTPNLEEQVSVFMSSCGRVCQSHLQATDSLLFDFCDSQGYIGGYFNLPPHGTRNI